MLTENPIPRDIHFSSRTKRMRSNAIREMLQVTHIPGMISLAGGNPAPETFPLTLLPKLQDLALKKYGTNALQYSETEGFEPLRKAIATLLERKGLPCSTAKILITNGSQGALDLLAKVLVDEGTPFAVEVPTYLGALQAFSPFGPLFCPLERDRDGVLPAALKQFAQEHPQGLVYLMPTFSNPTGHCMSMKRRNQLAEIIRIHSLCVIEDDPYTELRYEGEKLPPLVALCPDQVIYLGTLSKVFAPGLRLGFCRAHEDLFSWLVKAKQGTDLHTSTLNQALAAQYLEDGYLETRLPELRKIYKSRRDTMLESLKKELPQGFRWSHPSGGMFLWLEGPMDLDVNQLLPLALERGVAFVAGQAFNPFSGGSQNCLRLNFSLPDELHIQEGIRRLAASIHHLWDL
ncbi:MAG TPA: PLP-dependent aminotransferase family protein [Fibrobacteraceae bacterium]|nr:PLP-dependent aminotransferase family protein [Fibrobacteraceae bacterium]